jgi:prepilin signal peptidase PulO-like enzyme (type II secretory pathway)
VTGILFAASFLWWPYEFTTEGIVRLCFWLAALVLLVALFIYDFKWFKFPTILLRALLVLGVVQTVVIVLLSATSERMDVLVSVLLACLLGGGLFQLIYWFSNGNAIGDGDSYLGYGFGLILGAPLLSWMAITFASIIGSVVAIYLIAKGKSRKTKVPFGPFLISGVVISMLFGQTIWDYIGVLLVS